MSKPINTSDNLTNPSFNPTTTQSCLKSKAFAVSLLVSSVVLFGGAAVFGGIGLFVQTGGLPASLAAAIGTVGTQGCLALFAGGSILTLVGVVTSAVLLGLKRTVSTTQEDGTPPEEPNQVLPYQDAVNIYLNSQNPEETAANLTKLQEALLKKGPNTLSEAGATPLQEAVLQNNLKLVQALLTIQEIDLNTKDSQQKTVLHHITSQTDKEIVKALLAHASVDVNALQQETQQTALHLAVNDEDMQRVEILLNQTGINVNLQDSQGATSLHLAVAKGNKEIVKRLLAHPNIDSTLQNLEEKKAADLTENEEIKSLFQTNTETPPENINWRNPVEVLKGLWNGSWIFG